MSEYRATYKCRLCGEEIQRTSTRDKEDVEIQMKTLALFLPNFLILKPRIERQGQFHICA